MNFKCFFSHDWQKIGPVKPIEDDSEWGDNDNLGNFALGRCRKCGKKELQKVGWGGTTWLHNMTLTRKWYLEKYDNEESINKYIND